VERGVAGTQLHTAAAHADLLRAFKRRALFAYVTRIEILAGCAGYG